MVPSEELGYFVFPSKVIEILFAFRVAISRRQNGSVHPKPHHSVKKKKKKFKVKNLETVEVFGQKRNYRIANTLSDITQDENLNVATAPKSNSVNPAALDIKKNTNRNCKDQ